jgi:hypothetical protein
MSLKLEWVMWFFLSTEQLGGAGSARFLPYRGRNRGAITRVIKPTSSVRGSPKAR